MGALTTVFLLISLSCYCDISDLWSHLGIMSRLQLVPLLLSPLSMMQKKKKKLKKHAFCPQDLHSHFFLSHIFQLEAYRQSERGFTPSLSNFLLWKNVIKSRQFSIILHWLQLSAEALHNQVCLLKHCIPETKDKRQSGTPINQLQLRSLKPRTLTSGVRPNWSPLFTRPISSTMSRKERESAVSLQ